MDNFIEVKEEIGRRQYRELSFSERMVAIEGFIKNRCRLVRINYFLLEMVSLIAFL